MMRNGTSRLETLAMVRDSTACMALALGGMDGADPDLFGLPPRHRHETTNYSAKAGMMASMMYLRLRRARLTGIRRMSLPDRFELCLLFVAEIAIEILKRRAHGFDRLQHDIEPLARGLQPRRRRNGFVRLA